MKGFSLSHKVKHVWKCVYNKWRVLVSRRQLNLFESVFTANQGFKPLAERMMCLKARLLRCFLVARVNAGGTDGQSRVVVEVVICAERGTELRNVLHSKWIIMEALFLTICYYLYTFYVWLREGNFFCLTIPQAPEHCVNNVARCCPKLCGIFVLPFSSGLLRCYTAGLEIFIWIKALRSEWFLKCSLPVQMLNSSWQKRSQENNDVYFGGFVAIKKRSQLYRWCFG